MRRVRTITAAAGLFTAILASHGSALAKNVCVHTTAQGGWTFVFKASSRPGAAGAVQGYSIRDDGFASPISGGYAVGGVILHLGITRYTSGFFVQNFTGGSNSTTAFHHVLVRFDGSSGTDIGWMNTETGSIVNASGVVRLVDCRTVPRLPRVVM